MPLCRQIESLAGVDHESLFACAWVYLRTDRQSAGDSILEKQKRLSMLPEYQVLSAYSKLKKKQYSDAARILDTVRTEHKGQPIGRLAEETYAEVKENQGDMATAAFIYKQVITADSKRGTAHWGLGRYYLSRGDMRLAIQHLENTARLWPKHVGSRFNLAVIYNNLDDVKLAAKWLTECYRLNKADAGVLEELGNLFEKKGQIKEAVKYWAKALDVNKDSKIAREKLGVHFNAVLEEMMDSKRYVQALAKLENSGLSVEDRAELLVKRGIIYRNLGKYEKAAADLKSYLKDHPKDPTGQRELGICYLNMGLNDQALKLFEKASALDPENGFNHAWMGYVLEGKGELKAARDSWQKAIELFKDPQELKKASRRLATIEKRLSRQDSKKQKNPMEMGLDLKPAEEYDE